MWTERYATQPEILRYLEHVADRFDLRRDIRFHTRVDAGRLRRDANTLDASTTDAGERVTARYCILAVGSLSSTKRARHSRASTTSRATWYHTGRWPHEGVDFTGKRVGVIGTGSTGIQSIPLIARQAEHLYVFQRTPNYSMPARNRPLDPASVRARSRPTTPSAGARRASSRDPGVAASRRRRSALEVTPTSAAAAYEAGWARGGIGALSRPVHRPAHERRGERHRRRVRARARSARSCTTRPSPSCCARRTTIGMQAHSASTSATSRPTTATNVDAGRRPPLADRGDHCRTASRTAEARVRARRDRVRDRLRRHDRARCSTSTSAARDGRALRDKWARRAAHVPRPGDRGLPEPVHDHRARAARRCSATWSLSIEQHVDWIADCLAYLRTSGLDAHRGDGRGRGRLGRSTSTSSPTRRSTPWRTRGTSARTSRASRGCSCRTSAVAGATGGSATGRGGGVRGVHARGGAGQLGSSPRVTLSWPVVPSW